MKTNYKKSVNQRIENVTKDPSFITPNSNAKTYKPFPKWGKISIAVASSLAVVTGVTLSIIYLTPKPEQNDDNRVKVEISTFSASTKNTENINTQVAELNSLNNIIYPSTRKNESYTTDEMNNYLDFSHKVFLETGKKAYSPLTLYQVLNGTKEGISDQTLKTKMTELLGKDINVSDFAVKMFENNFYSTENGTTQIHNGAFYNTDILDISYNQEYVNKLTNYYFEAYNLSYSTGAQKMVDWVNKVLNSEDMVDKDFLEMNNKSFLYLFSAMYFDHFWENKYISDLNSVGDFMLSNGETIKTTYMRHNYKVDSYYEYDKYISFNDFYCNGNKVTFLLPKDGVEEDILDIVGDSNFLMENEENKVNRPYDEEMSVYKNIYVNLKTPKFEQTNEINFNETFKSLGFADLFDDSKDYLSGVANDPNNIYNVYIGNIKQKNNVGFNEDGSYIKSVAYVSMEAGSSAPPNDIYLNINLAKPFIYIIKDQGGLPLYIGYMDNPAK